MEKQENTPEKNCYSNEELQFFKELILKKREEAIHNLEMLNEAVAGDANDVNDTAPTFKNLEEGRNVLSKEENSRLAARQQKFIKDLNVKIYLTLILRYWIQSSILESIIALVKRLERLEILYSNQRMSFRCSAHHGGTCTADGLLLSRFRH